MSITEYMLNLQNQITAMLEKEEGAPLFQEEIWTHKEGGGGRTRVAEQGQVIEKAGVNFSSVQGDALPHSATEKRGGLEHSRFQAVGVSTVIHPRNPFAPTAHANVRYISVQKEDSVHWWFGGGFDLTPYYGFVDDCTEWHQIAKAACDPYGSTVYATYKKACDDYFYLPHRKEQRGIGGLFFDDLNEWGFEQCFNFIQAVGSAFIQAYQLILSRRKSMAYTEQERTFQAYRRGRYVEFNLLYDRGTLFGLQSGGRTESILVSLPPSVNFKYNWHPQSGTPEYNLYKDFLIPRSWVS